jgi:hypothetical protein
MRRLIVQDPKPWLPEQRINPPHRWRLEQEQLTTTANEQTTSNNPVLQQAWVAGQHRSY